MNASISLSVWLADGIAFVLIFALAKRVIDVWRGKRQTPVVSPYWRISFLTGSNPKRWAGYAMGQTALYLTFVFMTLSVPASAFSGWAFALCASLAILCLVLNITIICFWWPKFLIPRTLRDGTALMAAARARIKRAKARR